MTATPPASSYDIAVTRTFSSGSGYKLEVLNPSMTYTFSLVAKNASGTSTAVTTTATTLYASISPSPTITRTTLAKSFGTNSAYTFIASPKTSPNIVYVLEFLSSSSPVKLWYSTDSGVNFTNIGSRLKWNSGDGATTSDLTGAGLCCSDDGRYVYVQPYYRYLNISTDYGATFNFSKSPSSNNTAHSALTSPSGDIYMMSGGGASPGYMPTSTNVIHWSNNYNATYKYVSSASNYGMAVDFSNNIVYYSNNTTLRRYNAGSSTNLRTFDFATVSFASDTSSNSVAFSSINKIVSKGGITVLGCASVPKIRITTNGLTWTNPVYFNTGAGNVVNMGLGSTITIEPSVGFIMVHDCQATSRFFYSIDRGSSWQQYTPSPVIANASASSCVVKDTNLIVTIVSNTELHTFTIPINIS